MVIGAYPKVLTEIGVFKHSRKKIPRRKGVVRRNYYGRIDLARGGLSRGVRNLG